MLRFLTAVVTFIIFTSTAIYAQQSEWQWLDVGLTSWFRNDDMTLVTEGFQRTDSLWWFIQDPESFWHLTNLHETTDGGKTWRQRPFYPQVSEHRIPIPHRKTVDGVFYSTTLISYDSMETWHKFGLSYLGDDIRQWKPSLYSRNYGCADITTEISHPNAPQGIGATLPLHRLIAIADGKSGWQLMDSAIAVVTADTVTTTITSTIGGALPAPADFTEPIHEWIGAPQMLDSTVIRVVCRAMELAKSKRQRYFVGYLNRGNNTAKWYPLPDEFSSQPLQLFAPVPSVLYLRKFASGGVTLMRSADSGARWQRITLPQRSPKWIASPSHFVGHSVIIGELPGTYQGQFFRSTDAGATWEFVATPYARWGNTEVGGIDGGSFRTRTNIQPIDSLRIAFIGHGSMMFLSEDGGKTFRKNAPAGFPFAFATAGSTVLLGRELQTLLYSENEGLTWRELGAEGRLPTELSAIFTLAFVDTATPAGSVIGVAAFIGSEGDARLSIIRSDDGGINWSEGWKIPDSLTTDVIGAGMVFRQLPQLSFHRSSDGKLTRGFLTIRGCLFTSDDGGRSWQRQSGIPLAVTGPTMLNADVGLTSDTLPDRTVRFLSTTDGGVQWRVIYTTRPRAYPASCVMFGPEVIRCFFCYEGTPDAGVILMSDDGGKTWDSVATSVLAGSLVYPWFVRWIDPNTFYNFWTNTIDRVTIQPGSDTAALKKIQIPEQPYSRLTLRAYGASRKWFYVAGDSNVIARFPVPASRVAEPPITPPVTRLIPNMTGEKAVLQLLEFEGVSVIVRDMLGSEVSRLRPSSHQVELDIRGIPSGRYMLQIFSRHGVESLPLTVLR